MEKNIKLEDIKFSVIVPVYNVEKTIQRCLNSIINQTYKNIEILLINDGSTDSSKQICEKYVSLDDRVILINKKNGGLSSARNMGIENATGDYYCFIDSDDWISIDMIKHMADLINEYDCEIVSTTYKLIYSECVKDSAESYKINIMNREESIEYFLRTGMSNRISEYPVCIKCFKDSLFDEIRFPEGVLFEDYATNIELMRLANTYIKSSKVCYYYFQNGTSIVRSNFKKNDQDLIYQSKKVEALLEGYPRNIRRLAKEKTIRSYFSLLTKISIYGFDNSVDLNQRKMIISNYRKNLIENYLLLIKSSMPFNRKLMLTLIIIDYRIFSLIAKGVKR